VATPIHPLVAAPSPAADPDEPDQPAQRELPELLVRFTADSILSALAFADAIAGTSADADRTGVAADGGNRQPSFYPCHISGVDRSIWYGLDEHAPGGVAAELAVALGGTIIWSRDVLPGAPAAPAGSGQVPDPAAALEPVPLIWLASLLMPAGRPGPLTDITVVTTGQLAGPIVRRWQRARAHVTVRQLFIEPLSPYDLPAEPGGYQAVLIRITSRDGLLPRQAIAALTDLPHTAVCRMSDRLLIDVRFTLPIDDRHLVAEIPVGETWIASGGDFGLWRIISRGAEVVPPMRLAFVVPSGGGPLSGDVSGIGTSGGVPDQPTLARLAPVRVVPAARPDGRADAVLLDDLELARLRRFLSMSPLADTAFIVPGPGRHLLTEPAGLLTAVPFGVPVCRIGPGGLYLEAGHELDPPVPLTARQELFQLDNQSVVVLCHDGAYRLALSGMVPAWRLWLGEAPEPASGISARGRQLLAGLAPPGQPFTTPREQGGESGRAGQGDQPLNLGHLLSEAEHLEQRGELAGAARRLEEAGELYRAAVLYQRAAREAAARRR